MVLSLSAKGLPHGEISAHLAEIYGAEISKLTISMRKPPVVLRATVIAPRVTRERGSTAPL